VNPDASQAGAGEVRYPYRSLEDFLIAKMLTVDGEADDGWGAGFPVKGREIEASVLFADITGFSARTADLDPTETLAFVNHFFAWITAEGLRGRPGIVDKYIGDEIMVVFSREFGSADPFVDAVQTARWMGENDVFAFLPHVGIASGPVIVGYVGTPLKYNCSVFGAPVAVAARCASEMPDCEGHFSSYMTFPAAEWGGRDFDEVFPPKRYREPDDSIVESPHAWDLLPPSSVDFKNLGQTEVRSIVRRAAWAPGQSAEDRAREIAELLAKAGRRWRRAKE
jgi:class 3 adenylate cyclase